jgi:hypothetical protein
MAERTDITRIKNLHKAAILAKPNVVGVGTGYKRSRGKLTSELSVVTLVKRKLPPTALAAEALVPASLDGVPTDVLEVGEIRALATPTDRWRPAPGGVSIGHYQITAGTLGVVVRDRGTGTRLILSNNHVLANSNDASEGDPILQPGPADGGIVGRDTIANLLRFEPIRYTSEPGTCSLASFYAAVGNFLAGLFGSKHRLDTIRQDPSAINYVDCALARPVNDGDVLDDILTIGKVTGTVEAALGMALRKSGRTTGFTTGEVLVVDATVDVSYGTNQTARFEGQIIAGAMSEGGDSGSLVVSGDPPKAVGLLFAGSSQSTILNPIQLVLDALEIDI